MLRTENKMPPTFVRCIETIETRRRGCLFHTIPKRTSQVKNEMAE